MFSAGQKCGLRENSGRAFPGTSQFHLAPVSLIFFVTLPLCLVICVQLKRTRKELIGGPSGTLLLSHRMWRERSATKITGHPSPEFILFWQVLFVWNVCPRNQSLQRVSLIVKIYHALITRELFYQKLYPREYALSKTTFGAN